MMVLIMDGPHEGQVVDVPDTPEVLMLPTVGSDALRPATVHRYRRQRSSNPQADLLNGVHALYTWEP